MKKFISLLLTSVLLLSACGKTPAEAPKSSEAAPATTEEAKTEETKTEETKTEEASSGYELALITDVGTIDDKSFNQGSWEGLEAYAKEFNKTYKYYKPADKADDAYISSIELAIKGGAKVIVCPGYLFETPVLKMQEKYPDVKFLILDGEPRDESGASVIAANTLSVYYAEEQAGFLAGYAAVTDGHKKLGFMGGIAVPPVVRFGYGFIQGADQAAKDLGIPKDEIEVKYTYVGNFDATPENAAKAAAWFNSGTEVIFACGGAVGNSVMKAAETAGKKVIGVDVDQSAESKTVMTSATKNLQKSVYDALTAYYDGKFEGGKSITLDAKSEGVGLPMDTSVFTVFNKEKYDELYKKLADGSIKVVRDDVGEKATDVPVELVKVQSIE